MRIIRKNNNLRIENRDFLYGILIFGVIMIIGVIGFSNAETNRIGGMMLGSLLILLSIATPANNIVLDYNKKELYVLRESIFFRYSIKTFLIKDIKKIYAEVESSKFINWYRYEMKVSKKNGEIEIIYKAPSGRAGIILGNNKLSLVYDRIISIAKELDDKTHALSKK